MNLRNLPLFLGAVAIGCLMVMLVGVIAGRWALVFIGLFGSAAITSFRAVKMPTHLPWFAVTAVAFLVTARIGGQESQVAGADCTWLVSAAALGLCIVAITPTRDEWFLFWRYTTRAIFLIGSAAAALGIVKLALATSGNPLSWFVDSTGRPIVGTSTTPEYNTYTYAMALTLAASFWMRRRENSVYLANLAEAMIPVQMMAMLLTGSRRAVLFAAVGALGLIASRLWTLRRPGERKAASRRNYAAYAAYAAVVLVVTFGSDVLWDSIVDFFESGEVEYVVDRGAMAFGAEGFETRLPYLELSWDIFQSYTTEEKLLGRGFEYTFQLGSLLRNSITEEDYPHNFLLSALLYGGIVQAGVLLGCLWSGWLNLWRARNNAGPLMFMLVVSVLFSFVSSNSFFSVPMSTLILILAGHPVFAEMFREDAARRAEAMRGTERARRSALAALTRPAVVS